MFAGQRWLGGVYWVLASPIIIKIALPVFLYFLHLLRPQAIDGQKSRSVFFVTYCTLKRTQFNNSLNSNMVIWIMQYSNKRRASVYLLYICYISELCVLGRGKILAHLANENKWIRITCANKTSWRADVNTYMYIRVFHPALLFFNFVGFQHYNVFFSEKIIRSQNLKTKFILTIIEETFKIHDFSSLHIHGKESG